MIYVLLLAEWSFVPASAYVVPAAGRPRHVYHLGAATSGSTQQQTLKVVQQAEDYFLKNEKQNVESVFATIGSGSGGNGRTWRVCSYA